MRSFKTFKLPPKKMDATFSLSKTPIRRNSKKIGNTFESMFESFCRAKGLGVIKFPQIGAIVKAKGIGGLAPAPIVCDFAVCRKNQVVFVDCKVVSSGVINYSYVYSLNLLSKSKKINSTGNQAKTMARFQRDSRSDIVVGGFFVKFVSPEPITLKQKDTYVFFSSYDFLYLKRGHKFEVDKLPSRILQFTGSLQSFPIEKIFSIKEFSREGL